MNWELTMHREIPLGNPEPSQRVSPQISLPQRISGGGVRGGRRERGRIKTEAPCAGGAKNRHTCRAMQINWLAWNEVRPNVCSRLEERICEEVVREFDRRCGISDNETLN